MSALLASAFIGGLAGGLVAWIVTTRFTKRGGDAAEQASPGTTESAAVDASVAMPDPQLDPLAAEFSQHARAVRQQVSRYADLLADGDAVLRARLRRFEDGVS